MWNDQSAVGGGFFNAPNQFENTNTPNQSEKAGRRATRTAPIVIRQALRSGDDGVKIWGTEIKIISLVAHVRNIIMQSTKVTYTIQDMTGTMTAVLWLDQENTDEDGKSTPKVNVNDYVQIYGTVKTNNSVKVIMIFKITQIKDVNAITFHYLLCINNKVKMEADSKKKKSEISTAGSSSGLPANSMVGVNETTSINGLNARQMMVFNLIRASTLEQGISKQDMYASLKDRMSEKEFENILEWMCGEGHIYSTIDEEHFRATDAF